MRDDLSRIVGTAKHIADNASISNQTFQRWESLDEIGIGDNFGVDDWFFRANKDIQKEKCS